MASPAPTPPPRAPARRAPRGLLLPRERSRRWPSALVALLVHAGIIALLLWHHRWIEPGGGGQGGGVGPGVGNDSGPGTGGAAPVPFPPRQRLTTASLPECVWQSRARRVTITFWVDSTGRVERSEIDPRPRDASCARDYIDAMTRAGFEPARAANGARIAGTATVTYSR